MDKNQNPTPPVSDQTTNVIPDSSQPVIPTSPQTVVHDQIGDPVPNNSNPIKPASKFSLKAIISTIIFLLLAGGAAVGYVYREPIAKLVSKPTPTPNVTSPIPQQELNTFSNHEGNYSLSYPSNWKFSEHSNSEDERGTSIGKRDGSNIQAYISISTLNTLCGLQCQQMTEEKFFDGKNQFYKTGDIGGGGPGVTVEKVSETLVGNKRAIVSERHPSTQYADAGNFTGPENLYIVYHVYLANSENEVMEITLSEYVDDNKGLEEFNQILSTFKFTDSQTIDTSSWKTYEYSFEKFKIKFLYPPEFKGHLEGPEYIYTLDDGNKNSITVSFPIWPLKDKYEEEQNNSSKTLNLVVSKGKVQSGYDYVLSAKKQSTDLDYAILWVNVPTAYNDQLIQFYFKLKNPMYSYDKSLELIENIMSSFQVIEK